MRHSAPLICHAVPQEASNFAHAVKAAGWNCLETGMGSSAAAKALNAALARFKPSLVLSVGFAGALRPEFNLGTLVRSDPFPAQWMSALPEAYPIQFHCSPQVAVTRAQKYSLRKTTGADAVEMESGSIIQICEREGIPAYILRVISDEADEDLPLNFNRFISTGGKNQLSKLLLHVATHPKKLGSLMKFQRRIKHASAVLGRAITTLTVHPIHS